MTRIEQLIGDIEDYIADCKTNPFSGGKILVQRDELEEKLLELRSAIPDEVQQCQKMLSNREAILNDAKRQAQETLDKANAEAQQQIDQHEIMQRALATAEKVKSDALTQAQGIVDSATEQANGIRMGSIRYTDDMLKSLQTIINHTLTESQSKFDSLQNSLQSSYDIVSSNRAELAQGMNGGDAAEQQGQQV